MRAKLGEGPEEGRGRLWVGAPDACPAAPPVQVYDVIADEGEHHDLAPTNATLVAALMKVLRKYNESEYVDALYHRVPLETTCPKTAGGVLTPC